MTRRTRGILILLSVLALLAGVEVVLNLLKGPEACVQVENLGAEPIENLVLTCGSARSSLARIGPGESAKLYLSGHGTNTLVMTFRQRGNAMTAFQTPGFNPAQMNREGFKLMLRVGANQVERFQDDSEPSTPLGRFARKLRDWVGESFSLDPEP